MKNTFSAIALATLIVGLTAGAARVQAAAPYPTLGDAAFVPYYTVNGDWVTGVHIANTSSLTQVVKVRLRRASDSLDVLDFNLILSPGDVWTGTLSGDDQEMRFSTEDDSCTAPELLDDGAGGTYAPVFGPRLEGAQEGYIEVIGMGSASPAQLIAIDALHGSGGVPANCDRVRDNFFVAAVVDNNVTVIDPGNPQLNGTSVYKDTGNVLKVSYFLRNYSAGIGFGNSAVHFTNFLTTAAMTHQQFGLELYAIEPVRSLYGWDFPDVRGGGSNTDVRSSFDVVRAQLGADAVLNEWSYDPGTATDWVMAFPGQYAMVDFYQLEAGLEADDMWDYREIPLIARFKVLDREEQPTIPGGLNFTPSPAPDAALLENEVNVIEWGGSSVLDSDRVVPVNPADAGIGAAHGWAEIALEATRPYHSSDNAWCDVAAGPLAGSPFNGGDYCAMVPVTGPVPTMGFAAWERTFSEIPGEGYGYLVEHSATVVAPGC